MAGVLWLSCWARALGLFIQTWLEPMAVVQHLTQAPGLGLVAEKWSRCAADELEKGLVAMQGQ